MEITQVIQRTQHGAFQGNLSPVFRKRKKKSSLPHVWIITRNWGETVSMTFYRKCRHNLKAEEEYHVQSQSHHAQVFQKQNEVQYLSFKLNYSGGKDELEADFDWIYLPTYGTWLMKTFFPFLWSSLKRLQYKWGLLWNEDCTLREHSQERKQPKPTLWSARVCNYQNKNWREISFPLQTGDNTGHATLRSLVILKVLVFSSTIDVCFH